MLCLVVLFYTTECQRFSATRFLKRAAILDQETIKLLREADWAAIRRRLLVYTTWRASNYRWNRGEIPELAEGYTVEDVVQEVIVKTLSGVRRWAPAKGQLLPWLQAQCCSVIDALAKSASHRREVCILEGENLAQSPSNPLELLLEEEAEAQTQRKVKALLQAVGEETELQQVLHAVMSGCEPWPRHIAREIDISVRDADNRLKRLRRRASRLTKDNA
jgi:DNA-directed RNA polymerase specialized sigma24 family protein